jgi:L-seryl-tRNA(Ser) seleniumtransferase
MDVYEKLGVRKVINAQGNLTKLGGSLMPPVVLEAMAEAAKAFVDLNELQAKVGQRIAELTHNEAAYVSCGAAAGMAIVTAACIAGKDPARIRQLPNLEGLKDELVIHKSHRFRYDQAFRQVGVKLVEIGLADRTERWDLETAINERTVAVAYIIAGFTGRAELPLTEVVEIAHGAGVPVIVDAAAQLPPASNLWKFTTEMGADVAIFSGGKNLRGPQCSGLVLGRREIIEACALNANPNHSLGRSMKVGKEEMVGLLAAVEWFLGRDHEAWARACEEAVQYLIREFSPLPHVTTQRSFPNVAGQPLPRALLTFDEQGLGLTRDDIVRQLREGEPSIALLPAGDRGIYINPMTLEEGEVELVAARLKEILLH